jgi:hypothetical protein
MHHRVYWTAGEDRRQAGLVQQVNLVEFQALAGDLLHAPQGFLLAVGEVIHHDHLIASAQQLDAGVAPDITCPAGHQNSHVSISFVLTTDGHG